jgi:hypothetical protein
MGSRSRRRQGYAWFGALALILTIVAGCTSAGPTQPDNAGPMGAGAHAGLPNSSGPLSTGGPRESAGTVTVDQITATISYGGEYVTPLAHLYGKFFEDYVIITVQNDNSSPVKVMATSEVTGFTDIASDTVTVQAGGSAEIRQDPRLSTTAIDGLNSAHDANVHIVVSYLDNGQPRTILDQTNPTTVTSRRDFPLQGIEGFTQAEVYQLLAVMVTPTDPAEGDLIRKAAEYAPNKAMGAGAAEKGNGFDPVRETAQLKAIWEAEDKDYHLTYVSTTETFAAKSQRIRLPHEDLAEASGNCIELSLLYASAVESLGFIPYAVIIPGHVYFLVDLEGDGQNLLVIETTMIGQRTFEEATAYGLQEWERDAAHVNAGDQYYGLLNVLKARQDGITPIPWQ